MEQWVEVKIRYEKREETGKLANVTEPYLVDALSCTDAESRIIEEVTPFVSGEFNVLSVNKRKISEVFWSENGDRFYKVKINNITVNEKTGIENKKASFIIVQASTFNEAVSNFTNGMRGTLTYYEIESVTETKIVDVFKYHAPENNGD